MTGSIIDIPGIKVGHYTDLVAAKGCTVVLCENGAMAGVDVRGSAPGTRETDVLRPVSLVQKVHAVVLSGGSAFGLDTASGVMRYLDEKSIGYDTSGGRVPVVTAAVIFDLGIGNPRVRPGIEEGYKACLNASDKQVIEGCVGAGTGATVGKVLGIKYAVKSGLGTASEKIAGDVTVAAIVVVNALGDIIDPATGTIFAGTRNPEGRGFADSSLLIKSGSIQGKNPLNNTTIAVVATDAALDKEQVNKVAQMAQDGIARAVKPCHTMYDGDTIFALSLGEKTCDVDIVGISAADMVSMSIIRAIKKATTLAGVPSLESLS